MPVLPLHWWTLLPASRAVCPTLQPQLLLQHKARCLMALGQEEQALQVIESVPEKLRSHAEIASIRSALELAAEGRKARAKLAEFEARLAADPNDHAARIDLAVALNAMDNRAGAVDALIEAIKRDRAWNEEAARKQLLKFFELKLQEMSQRFRSG